MSKRRELEQANQHEDIGRTLHRVYAALYNNVPWVAVAAICMYLPGIVLWAVFALHCKADTFKFLTTIAPVDDSTVDGVSNLVNTTLIALIITATFIFMLALVLAIARSLQKAGAAPNSSFPCVRNSPSSFYLYRVFNLGYNFIVFFVNLFIIFLMMGAFLWLVVAYGANLSIKGGVLDAANIGTRPQLQYDLAKQNYTTVVSTYERQLKLAPVCVRNSTWLKEINSSIGSILKPQATNANDTSLGVALLCPQTCLNLGSWATLFKLKSGCMCEQDKLFLLQKYSLAVATDAGVALGGLILIYFGSCCMHYYLITERVHAGYDYKRAKRQASRRQQLNSSVNGSDPNRNGTDKGGPGGSGGSFAGPGGSGGGGLPDGNADGGPGGTGHHVIAMNGGSAGQDSYDPSIGGALMHSAHGQHQHQRSNSGSSAYDSLAKNVVDSGGGSFSVLQEGQQLQAGGMLAGGAAGAAAAGALAAAAAGRAGVQPDGSPFMAAGATQQGQDALLLQQQQQRLQVLNRHHRVSSGGGSSSSPVSGVGRQLQRIPSPHSASRSAAAAAAAAAAGGAALYHTDSGHSYRGTGSRVADWQQQQQQQQQHPLIANEHLRATSPPPLVGAWSAHGRSESRSSTSSIRDLLSGAVPLDAYGQVQRTGLTPTSSGNAAAAAMQQLQQQQQLRVPVIQEVPGTVPDSNSGMAAIVAAAPAVSASSSYAPAAAGARATHRRGDSEQSNSSSSSYDTVVCHSPRSSDPDNSSSASQAVLQAGGTAGAASAAFLSSASVTSRAQVARQSAAAAADAEVPAAPMAVGAAVDGEEALSGSKTGSWSKKQAHRRLPALDFTTAAPALWLAHEREQQQQQQQQGTQTAVAAAEAAGPGAGGAPGAAAAAAAVALGAAAVGGAAAAKVTGRAPVRRHIALDNEVDLSAAADVSGVPQQQQHVQLQEELSLDQGIASAQQGQHQQQHGQLASIEAVAAMLRPSPEPSEDEQQQRQQEVQAQMQGMRDIATLEAEQEQQQQQQRLRQRPPYSLLLPPPEQHELLLKQQQQQLQVLLQQAQEEQQQQQQQVWQQHQRQWSTSNISLAHSASSGGNSPSPALLRHHHSYSTPDAAAAAAAAAAAGSGLAASPYGSGSGIAVSTPSKYAPGFAGVPRASFGGVARTTSGGGVLGTSLQQQQQQGYMFPGSFSSSSAGGMRFAGSSSANGDDDSSPGEAGGSFSSRGFVPSTASAAAAAIAGGGAGAYGAPGSAAGGSMASSVFTTPQATPQSSPAPLRSGRVTPSYGLNLGGASSSSAGGVSGLTGSSSWSQLPPMGHGNVLTTSSSYSGSANAPGFAGGLNGLLAPAGVSTPRSVMSPLGREEVLPLQGAGSGYGLLNPSSSGSGSGLGFGLLNPSSITPQGSGVPAITPIPEVTSAEGLEGEGSLGGPLGGDSSLAAAAAAAAAAGSSMGQYQPQQQDVMESPLERRRSGYRSSMRKGLMAYDQYKHRHRYQDAVTQPLDPGSEVARRYRSRMPAI